jgi:hypothetical protein
VSALYLADTPDTATAEWYRLLAEYVDTIRGDLNDRLRRLGLQ